MVWLEEGLDEASKVDEGVGDFVVWLAVGLDKVCAMLLFLVEVGLGVGESVGDFEESLHVSFPPGAC